LRTGVAACFESVISRISSIKKSDDHVSYLHPSLEKKPMTEEEKNILKKIGMSAIEFIYGMAGHDMTRFALKTRGSMEHLFILITMGDLLGVPILPPYYSLRLLPYVVPQISTWKRRMLREKDLTDALA
jgi:hypothetical protein